MEARLLGRRDLRRHPERREGHGHEVVHEETHHASDLGRRQLPAHARPEAREVPLKIVVADEVPASALELLRAEPGWTVDARTGRASADLAADIADADALLVRSAAK